MQVINRLEEIKRLTQPVILSIGNFDGIHLGHLKVLQTAKEYAKRENRPFAVLTFSNHPVEVLQPGESVPLLCSPSHKIKLMEAHGVDFLMILPFTNAFSQQSPREFLNYLRQYVPFSHLILGYDATIGHKKRGDRFHVQEIANEEGFYLEYVEAYTTNNEVISSRKIRNCVQNGDLAKAESYLGRKFSIYDVVREGKTHGKKIGFPTANIEVAKLCLPPLGVYAVKVLFEDQELNAVANLGFAPTLKNDKTPTLEVHILDWNGDLYEQPIEVVFIKYLRAERRFENIQQLKEQIERDIKEARSTLLKIL